MKTNLKILLSQLKEFLNSSDSEFETEIFALETYYSIMKDLGYTFRLEECYPHVCIIYYVGFYEIKATFLLEKGLVIFEKI